MQDCQVDLREAWWRKGGRLVSLSARPTPDTDASDWVKAAAWYPRRELSRTARDANRMRRVCQSPSRLILFG